MDPAIGKTYTTEDIAREVMQLVPPPTASILDLVRAPLPEVIPEDKMKAIPAKDHLVNLDISGTLRSILDGPIPHRTWIASLRMELEKAEKSKHYVAAIRHPTEEDLILPLWALPVWESIAVASQERELWVQATEWLNPSSHRQEDRQDVEHVQDLLAKIPWGMKVWALGGVEAGSHVVLLARFLSFSWLSERNIDLMGVCCNATAVENGSRMRGHMAEVYLGAQLQAIGSWTAKRIQESSTLWGWKAFAEENRLRYIHIPTNLTNTHWVVFCIDIEEQTYCWGLSSLDLC